MEIILFFICKSLVWQTGGNPDTQEQQRPILDSRDFVKYNTPSLKPRNVRDAQRKESELWKTILLLTRVALRNS